LFERRIKLPCVDCLQIRASFGIGEMATIPRILKNADLKMSQDLAMRCLEIQLVHDFAT